MNNGLEIAQNKFIERLGHMTDKFGLNSFVAKLFALLYLNNKPLSLDEIAAALGVSKGNVSINIRELEKWGAVRKIWIKGSRKDYYQAEEDLKKVVLTKLKASVEKRLVEVSGMVDEFNSIIETARNDFTEEEKDIARGFEERFRKIEELKSLASNALQLAEKLL